MEEGEIVVTGSINSSRFGGVSASASRLPGVLGKDTDTNKTSKNNHVCRNNLQVLDRPSLKSHQLTARGVNMARLEL